MFVRDTVAIHGWQRVGTAMQGNPGYQETKKSEEFVSTKGL